jgi:hypothetical protein
MSDPEAYLTPSEGFVLGLEIIARSIAASLRRGYVRVSVKR